MLQQIESNIWQVELETTFTVGPVNIYIIINDERVMVVDAGVCTQGAWETFVHDLQTLDLTPEDIDCVVLTHQHLDHIGLLRYLPKNIELYGHWRVQPWITHDPDFESRYHWYFKERGKRMGVPKAYVQYLPTLEDYLKVGIKGVLSQPLTEGDHIPGFKDWKIIYTPGHAQSHISLFRHKDGVFIGGDLLLEHMVSTAIHEPPYYDEEQAPNPLLQYRASLNRCASLDIKKVLPGHGAPYCFPQVLIQERLSGQEVRREKVKNFLINVEQTTFQIGKRMFRGVFKKQLDSVLSEVQGYLDWLVEREEVQVREEDGTLYYKRQ